MDGEDIYKKEKYFYNLPKERIADHPLKERDQSKLLLYRRGKIEHRLFRDLPDVLDKKDLLIFNDTRVVSARINFRKNTGARVEIFCLEPAGEEISVAMTAESPVEWYCFVKNLKKWNKDQNLVKEIEIDGMKKELTASFLGEENGKYRIRFEWDAPGLSFSNILASAGEIPLPPYIKREVEEEDKYSYQTVYAKYEGAVAAPTAGLHFTPQVFEDLENREVDTGFVTLHVGAGTFKPLTSNDVRTHEMHEEVIVFTREILMKLLDAPRIVSVGTTSLRVLESIFWLGVRLIRGDKDFFIPQFYPYQIPQNEIPGKNECIRALLEEMDRNNTNSLKGRTGIMIMPGYEFQLADGLITNFHLPESTLIMLVAAFIGKGWKRVYQEALEKDYRFLSYGDSSILFR